MSATTQIFVSTDLKFKLSSDTATARGTLINSKVQTKGHQRTNSRTRKIAAAATAAVAAKRLAGAVMCAKPVFWSALPIYIYIYTHAYNAAAPVFIVLIRRVRV